MQNKILMCLKHSGTKCFGLIKLKLNCSVKTIFFFCGKILGRKKKLQPYIAVCLMFLHINIWNKKCEAPERVVLLGFGAGIQNLGNQVGEKYQQSLEITVKEITVKRKIQRRSWVFQQATYLKISPGHTAEYLQERKLKILDGILVP